MQGVVELSFKPRPGDESADDRTAVGEPLEDDDMSGFAGLKYGDQVAHGGRLQVTPIQGIELIPWRHDVPHMSVLPTAGVVIAAGVLQESTCAVSLNVMGCNEPDDVVASRHEQRADADLDHFAQCCIDLEALRDGRREVAAEVRDHLCSRVRQLPAPVFWSNPIGAASWSPRCGGEKVWLVASD